MLVMILFALSLDLALGYAGIVTLGHAAFFGVGAYTVGHARVITASGPSRSPACCSRLSSAAVIGLVSGLVLLRTTGLTLLDADALHHGAARGGRQSRRTNGPAALTGSTPACRSRRCSARSSSTRSIPTTQYLYALGVLFVCFLFVRTLVYSPFGAEPDRHPREHACACMRSARRCGSGSSSATRFRRRSPASRAGCGRSPTPMST